MSEQLRRPRTVLGLIGAVGLSAGAYLGYSAADTVFKYTEKTDAVIQHEDLSTICISAISKTRGHAATDPAVRKVCPGVNPASIQQLDVLRQDYDEAGFRGMLAAGSLILGGAAAASAYQYRNTKWTF